MDTVVYYRLSDGVVVGSTTSSQRINDREELSHYGPGVVALRVPTVEFKAGKILKVLGGHLELVVDPVYEAQQAKKKQDRQAALAKLKLTDDELAALLT